MTNGFTCYSYLLIFLNDRYSWAITHILYLNCSINQPIKLCYLITPLEREEDQNQLMLGRIIQRFHDQPVLESLGGTPLDNSHGGNSPEMRITFEALSMEELSHIWNALRTNYRLSTAYSVHVVTVDSAQAIAEAKRVVSAHTVVGVKE